VLTHSCILTHFQAFDWRPSEESGHLGAIAQVRRGRGAPAPPPPPPPRAGPPPAPRGGGGGGHSSRDNACWVTQGGRSGCA
jgi:hypothetical protein